jgi:HlyD family secretion protein
MKIKFPRIRVRHIVYGGIAVVILAVLAALPSLLPSDSLPEGLIQVNGRLEADTVVASTEYAGRVLSLDTAEGSQVEAGQPVAHLDSDRLKLQLAQAEDALNSLEKQVAAGEMDLNLKHKEKPLSIDQAESAVKRAAATLENADAAKNEAQRDLEQIQALRSSGTASMDRLHKAELALTTTSNQAVIAEAALAETKTQLASAQLADERIRAQKTKLDSLRAQRDQARSYVAEMHEVISKYVIEAPASGTVTTRLASLGETLAAGAPLFELVDLDRLYLKAYVPGPEIGRIKLGMTAQIFTDAYPDRPFAAEITYIASRAQFTPKDVQTHDARIKDVFAVKLHLDENPDHSLSPGMPADAIIRWKDDVAWSAPIQ